MLSQLLHPRSLQTFLADFFEQQPLVNAGAAKSVAADVLSLADFEQLLATSATSDGWVSIVRGRASAPEASHLNEEKFLDLASIYDAYASGATLLLTRLQKRSGAVASLCRSIERDLIAFGVPLARQLGANAYLTPPASQGFPVHYDDHCVLVLQLHGAKRWRIFGPLQPLPISRCTASPDPAALGRPLREVALEAGDVLYIPRGFHHDAQAGESDSLHLTLSIHVFTWRDLLLPVIENTAGMRRALPLRALDDGVDVSLARESFTLLEDDVTASIETLRDRMWSRIDPLPRDGLRHISKLGEISEETRLTKRAGSICVLTREADGGISLRFPGGGLHGGESMEAAFRFIAARDELSAREIPMGESDCDALELVRELIRGSVLQLSESSL